MNFAFDKNISKWRGQHKKYFNAGMFLLFALSGLLSKGKNPISTDFSFKR